MIVILSVMEAINIYLGRYPKKMANLFAIDLLIIALTYLATYLLASQIKSLVAWVEVKEYQIYSPLLGLSMLSFYLSGRYNLERSQRPGPLFLSLIPVLALAFLVYLVMVQFFAALRLSNLSLALFLGLAWMLLFAWRWFGVPAIRLEPRRVLLIGRNRLIDRIAQILQEEHAQVYAVADHWHRSSSNMARPALENYVQDHEIDLIVYASGSELVSQLASSLCSLRLKEKNIFDDQAFYQRLTGKIPIDYVDDVGLLMNSKREVWFPRLSAVARRLFDIVMVLISTPLALPLIIICGLVIKLDSKGPVFFIQERLGQNEKPFRLIKLRTMVHNAEKLSGPKWSSDKDPRKTAVGKVLRKTRLDELPQLFNVLKGDMTFVGPRPFRKHFADLLAEHIPHYRLRFLAKPGLTGWAQVNVGSGDYHNTMEGQKEKVEHDLFYLVRRSLALDFFIMLKTIRVVVAGKGI